MPIRICEEPNEIKGLSITEKLKYYKEHNMPEGIAQTCIDIYYDQFVNEKINLDNITEVENYLSEFVHGDPDNNHELSEENKQFIYAVWEKYWDYRCQTALEFEKKTEKWREKVNNGEIDHCYVVEGDEKRTNQLVKDLTVSEYGKAFDIFPFSQNFLKSCFNKHSANINKVYINEALDDKSEEFIAAFAKKNNIDAIKMRKLISETTEHEPSHEKTGLKTRMHWKEGENPIESIDPIITAQEQKTDRQLFDRSEELIKQIEDSKRFVNDFKQSVENAKSMLARLEAARKPGEPQLDDDGNPIDTNSQTYKDLHKALTEYCKIGTAQYKLVVNDMEVNTNHYDRFVLKQATDRLMEAASNYETAHSGTSHLFQSNWGYGKERLNISREAKQLCKFNNIYLKASPAKGELIIEQERELRFVRAELKNHRKQEVVQLDNKNVPFSNDIGQKADGLRRSVTKNCVDAKAYSELFELTDHSQRICRQLEAAKKANDLAAQRRAAMALEENAREVSKKLKTCKKIENDYKPDAPDTSANKNARKTMINELSATMETVRQNMLDLGKELKPQVEKQIMVNRHKDIMEEADIAVISLDASLKNATRNLTTTKGKKHVHKLLAVGVANHMLKSGKGTDIITKMTENAKMDEKYDAEIGFNALVNGIASSKAFLDAAKGLTSKEKLLEFVDDDNGPAKLSDKFLANLAVEKKAQEANKAKGTQGAKTKTTDPSLKRTSVKHK